MQYKILLVSFIYPLILLMNNSYAKEYQIYSILHELPMKNTKKKEMRKDYYMNMGTNQGLKKGTLIDVYRVVTRNDPFNHDKNYSYRLPVAILKVIHSERNSAIARKFKMINKNDQDAPIFDLKSVLIGDRVDIHVN